MEDKKTKENETPPAPAPAPDRRALDKQTGEGRSSTGALEPVVDVLSPLEETVGAVVDRWVLDHIHGSPVARSTEAYNHLKDSLPHLKASLLAALKGD